MFLPAGSYWLGYWYGASAATVTYATLSGAGRTVADTYSSTGTPNDPFGSGSSSDSELSLYASFEPVTSGVTDQPLLSSFTTTLGPDCPSSCSFAGAGREWKATVAGGGAGYDSAYGTADFGGSSGVSGPVFLRDTLRLDQGQALTANLAVLELRDVSGNQMLELYLDSSGVLHLWSPAGGLGSGSINDSAGVTVPNDGVTANALRVEVEAEKNNLVIVRVNGQTKISETGLSGATTGNPRYLEIGIDHYDSTSPDEPVTVYHGEPGVSTVDWLADRTIQGELPLLGNFTAASDYGCSGCSFSESGGEWDASISGGSDNEDSAVGYEDLSQITSQGRVWVRDDLRLSKTPTANLAVLEVYDPDGNQVYELYVDSTGTLNLYSPPGGLEASSLNESTGQTVSTGSTPTVIEVSALADADAVVKVNGVEALDLYGLTGATTGGQSLLEVGIDHYDSSSSSDAITAYHSNVGVSAYGWLADRTSALAADAGNQRYYHFSSQTLTDRSQIGVNLANGNLLLDALDMRLAGVAGLDLLLERDYNSLTPQAGPLGAGWQYQNGYQVRLVQLPDGDVVFSGPSGYQVVFADDSGSYVSPDGADQTLVHDGDGSWTLTTHADGSKLVFGADGDLFHLEDRNGNEITFANTQSEDPKSIADSFANTTTFTLEPDGSGRIETVTDPAGRSYSYGYDSSGDLVSYTDPNNQQTTYGYGAGHLLTEITDPLGNETTISYDSLRRVTQVVRVTDTTNGTGPTTSFTYNSGSTVVTDPNGNETTYSYDSSERLTRVTDALGNSQTINYSGGGSNCGDDNPCSVTDADGHTTSFGYNASSAATPTQGELELYSQSPLEGTSNRPTFAYADSHNPYFATEFTNPQGHSWSYAYDQSTGNMTSGGPNGQTPVSFTYNTDGTVATATDAKGNETSYGYTGHDLTSITPPSPLGKTTISYDSLNRVSTITDGRGQTRSFSYDPLDRITQIAYTGGPTLTFTYDADGNLTNETDPTGSYSYSYDALNRETQDSLPGSRTVSYSYDPASNLKTLTDPQGTTDYSYDQDERPSAVTDPWASGAIALHYDNNSNLNELDYPNGITQTLSYDASQRLASIVAEKGMTVVDAYCYTYSSGGADTDLRQSVTNVSSSIPGCPSTGTAVTTTYGYDQLDRLASATGGGSDYAYYYDADGNICATYVGSTATSLSSCSDSKATTLYGINAANEITNTGFSYDADGNQTANPNVYSSASYNDLNQMSSVTPNGGSALTMNYSRTGQAIRTAAGASSYTNDLLGLESETSGTDTADYIRDPDGTVLALHNPAGGTGGDYYLLFDGLGSTTNLTDANGNVVDSFTYTPYGQASVSGSVTEPIQYAGGYNDNASGNENLIKFGQRYLDPSTGRWTQIDPINNPLDQHGWNQYNYAGDDPVNYVDPDGTSLCGFLGHSLCRVAGDIARETIGGAIIGATVGCTAGAIAAAELGPAGLVGGCLISAVPGATIGAQAGFFDAIYPYVGDLNPSR